MWCSQKNFLYGIPRRTKLILISKELKKNCNDAAKQIALETLFKTKNFSAKAFLEPYPTYMLEYVFWWK